MTNRLSCDLDYILKHTLPLWDSLRDQRIFITGGTGFFGCWLLESFVWANRLLNLNASAVVLTRNAAQFEKKCPHLFLDPSLTFHEGDVQNFEFPDGVFSSVIHAATDVSSPVNKDSSDLVFDTIVQGTKHTLNFALHCKASRFLMTSSGAVYGKQPCELSHISEDYLDNSIPQEEIKSAYAGGKREAEKLCAHYAEISQLDIKIARCFAFVGPYLPLDSHFAIGNFIRDGLNGEAIIVKGDGTASRSYLYAADLAIWLWTILFQGKRMRPYNVGSDEALSIHDLAYDVARLFDLISVVKIQQTRLSCLSDRYVPDIYRARNELNLSVNVPLRRALQLTKEWYLYDSN